MEFFEIIEKRRTIRDFKNKGCNYHKAKGYSY